MIWNQICWLPHLRWNAEDYLMRFAHPEQNRDQALQILENFCCICKHNNINFFHASTNLYYNFCKFGGKFAILAGSSAECNLRNKIVDEKEVDLKFKFSEYSISKYLFMRNVKKISNIFKSDFAWARLFWIYGKNQPYGKLISDMTQHIKQKKNFVLHI